MECFNIHRISVTNNSNVTKDKSETIKNSLCDAVYIVEKHAKKHDIPEIIRNICLLTDNMSLLIISKKINSQKQYNTAIIAYNNSTHEIMHEISIDKLSRLSKKNSYLWIEDTIATQQETIVPDFAKEYAIDYINKPENMKPPFSENNKDIVTLWSDKKFCYGNIIPYLKDDVIQQIKTYDGYTVRQDVSYNHKHWRCITFNDNWCIAPIELIKPEYIPKFTSLSVKTIDKMLVQVSRKNGKPVIDDDVISLSTDSELNKHDDYNYKF